MSVDTARYSGRTVWEDGICWLVLRTAENGRIDTTTAHLISMDGRHSSDRPWAEVVGMFNQGLTRRDSRGRFCS